MKKIILSGFMLLFLMQAKAQKRQNTYLLKDNGTEVLNRDSADFVRIIEEPDSGETNYNVLEFYKDGTKKLVGRVSSFMPKLIFEGAVVTYNKKGNRVKTVNYLHNDRIGTAFFFFENGKVQKQLEYLPKEAKPAGAPFKQEEKMIYLVDSLGTEMVKDGNGHAVEITKMKDDELIEEGDYKNGFKEGTWTGKHQSKNSKYTETYSLGKLLAGINSVDGIDYSYTDLGTPPEFKGGINAFYKYLGKSIRYPKDAAYNHISGNVVVNFVIEKDGQITEAKIGKPAFASINQEALRVIMTSPKWVPGVDRGVPVRVKYNVPITFHVQ